VSDIQIDRTTKERVTEFVVLTIGFTMLFATVVMIYNMSGNIMLALLILIGVPITAILQAIVGGVEGEEK
jgi:sensor histidine kinase YesM